jgi:hypothetical protein
MMMLATACCTGSDAPMARCKAPPKPAAGRGCADRGRHRGQIMDVFNYAEHFVHRIAVAHDPKSLIQIELHPGLHCDLYRCPHCYGHGQHIMPGEVLSAAEIDAALADVAASAPTIIVSGIATEPLTHPDAVGILQAIKRQRLPLGLYTKGLNLVPQVRQSLLDGESETFVTVSLDAVSGADYMIKHNIAAGPKDEGRNYHERVLDNLRQFRIERDRVGARVEIRAAFLFGHGSRRDDRARAGDRGAACGSTAFLVSPGTQRRCPAGTAAAGSP